MNKYFKPLFLITLGLLVSFGMKAENKEFDYQQAYQMMLPLAEKGHAVAQLFIGTMYYQGKVVQQDKQQAIKWLSKSAEQGNASAQTLLGAIYWEEKDKEKAKYYFHLACQNGNSDSCKLDATIKL